MFKLKHFVMMTTMLSLGVFFASCGGDNSLNNYPNDDNNHGGYYGDDYYDDDDDDYGSGSSGSTGSSETAYYIKHPWGNGSDASWSWEKMRRNGSTYTYTGQWGGVGANINTTASDNGAQWFASGSISGAKYVSVGSTVTFVYNPSSKSLSVEGGSNDSGSGSGNGSGNNSGNDSGYNDGGNTGGNSGGNSGGTSSPSVPNVPTGLSGTKGGPAMYPYISLSWNSVSDADSYIIYRASSANGSYREIGTSKYSSYSDESPLSGDNYYKVAAKNSAGTSDKSDYCFVSNSNEDYKPDFASIKGSKSGWNLTFKWTAATGTGKGTPEKVTIQYYANMNGSQDTLVEEEFTGSKASSGSYTFNYEYCMDTYGKVNVRFIISNKNGQNTHTVTFYNGSFSGTF